MWIWKTQSVTVHHVITVNDDMFDHLDSLMRALAKKMTQWQEDLCFTVKVAWQKLSKYNAELTPLTSMLVITADILNPVRKLRSYRQWDMGMDLNSENKTSNIAQCQEALLTYVENE